MYLNFTQTNKCPGFLDIIPLLLKYIHTYCQVWQKQKWLQLWTLPSPHTHAYTSNKMLRSQGMLYSDAYGYAWTSEKILKKHIITKSWWEMPDHVTMHLFVQVKKKKYFGPNFYMWPTPRGHLNTEQNRRVELSSFISVPVFTWHYKITNKPSKYSQAVSFFHLYLSTVIINLTTNMHGRIWIIPIIRKIPTTKQPINEHLFSQPINY